MVTSLGSESTAIKSVIPATFSPFHRCLYFLIVTNRNNVSKETDLDSPVLKAEAVGNAARNNHSYRPNQQANAPNISQLLPPASIKMQTDTTSAISCGVFTIHSELAAFNSA